MSSSLSVQPAGALIAGIVTCPEAKIVVYGILRSARGIFYGLGAARQQWLSCHYQNGVQNCPVSGAPSSHGRGETPGLRKPIFAGITAPMNTRIFPAAQSTIRLFCAYSASPGQGWQAEVQFRPNSTGFSIWESGLGTEKLSLVGEMPMPLSWWSAASFLAARAEQGTGLYGEEDLVDYVEVSGVEPWQGFLLAMCWIVDAECGGCVGQSLLSLSDDEIRDRWLERGNS